MQNKKLIMAIVRTAILFFTFVCVLTFYIGSTFGWFFQNSETSAGGMNPQADRSQVVIRSITTDGVGEVDGKTLRISFSNAYPGDSMLVTVKVECLEAVPSIVLGLNAPNGCDTPVKDAKGKFYYFGSQIQVSEVACDGVARANFSAVLVENGWAAANEVVPQNIELYRSGALSKGEHTLTMRFTFVNAEFDQGILKGFGSKPGQKAYRSLEVTY